MGETVVVLLVIAGCGVLRRWITHRTAVRHEAEATRRVELAVGGTSSAERAAVVRACAELETASHARLATATRTVSSAGRCAPYDLRRVRPQRFQR